MKGFRKFLRRYHDEDARQDAINLSLVDQNLGAFRMLENSRRLGYTGDMNESVSTYAKNLDAGNHMTSVIVTGGAGFIGSHLVRLINERFPKCKVHVVDCLTYAGNLDNLKGCNYELHQVDITDREAIMTKLDHIPLDAIFHLAAESHVDRSISNPDQFVKTNINGTLNLLDFALIKNRRNPKMIFYHISTDEVFGSLDLHTRNKFTEKTPYDPKSPYSASKAASDHLVRAYHHTYKLPILISNCSNNYGPAQYPEKLIPVVIQSIMNRKPIPVYGQGINVRDWLWVGDHADAILEIYENGRIGETYCIGGDNEIQNIDLIRVLCDEYEKLYGIQCKDLITFVEDRKGHDLRYAIDHQKITDEIDWNPKKEFREGLRETIEWYVNYFKSSK